MVFYCSSTLNEDIELAFRPFVEVFSKNKLFKTEKIDSTYKCFYNESENELPIEFQIKEINYCIDWLKSMNNRDAFLVPFNKL